MKLTRQRRIIFDALKATTAHPGADELYLPLKKKIPSLSLGSLYRNLEFLSREGLAIKIEGCGDSKRFDGRTDEHFHLFCQECGAVSDYFHSYSEDLRSLLGKISKSDPRVKSLKITFEGICETCLKKRSKK